MGSTPVRIALFRAINVGGRNRMPMQELKAVLTSVGCRDVETYIQSGNVVFRHPQSSDSQLIPALQEAIKAHFGFLPGFLLLQTAQFRAAIDANPFPQAVREPGTLHLWFMEEIPPAPEAQKMQALKSSSESLALVDRVFYLHAPQGVGRSKLAQSAERLLGVPATARNWRTVSRIAGLAKIGLS